MDLVTSNRGSSPARTLQTLPGSDVLHPFTSGRFDGAVETRPTGVTQIEAGVDSAIYVDDASRPLCSHLLVCDLHDVRRLQQLQP